MVDWLVPRNAAKVTPQDRFICLGLGDVGSRGLGGGGGHFGAGTPETDRETRRQKKRAGCGGRTF